MSRNKKVCFIILDIIIGLIICFIGYEIYLLNKDIFSMEKEISYYGNSIEKSVDLQNKISECKNENFKYLKLESDLSEITIVNKDLVDKIDYLEEQKNDYIDHINSYKKEIQKLK